MLSANTIGQEICWIAIAPAERNIFDLRMQNLTLSHMQNVLFAIPKLSDLGICELHVFTYANRSTYDIEIARLAYVKSSDLGAVH